MAGCCYLGILTDMFCRPPRDLYPVIHYDLFPFKSLWACISSEFVVYNTISDLNKDGDEIGFAMILCNDGKDTP